MKSWPEFKTSRLLEKLCESPHEVQYWTQIFDQMHADPQVLDTWDYQWIYACFSQNGLAIEPNYNLISNTGFNRPDAAHTVGDSPDQTFLLLRLAILTIRRLLFEIRRQISIPLTIFLVVSN